MSGSLLAFLYPHIKGSQEDVATLSLCHIISQSSALREPFTQLLLKRLHLSIDGELAYSTQVVGNDRERPDLVGFDQMGKERIICEVKFYAALTDNQPEGYLKRLNLNIDQGLIFLCPQSRLTGLWNQLLARCAEYQFVDDYCVSVSGVHLSIISWAEVLELLDLQDKQHNAGMGDDIHQLIGFYNIIESSEFLPFRAEDFGADVAKSIERYSMLLDSVTNHILGKKEFCPSTKGLRSTPQRYGYTKYINIGSFSIGLYYDRKLWLKTTSIYTPFWLAIHTKDWKQTEEIVRYCSLLPDRMTERSQNGAVYIALEAPTACTLEEAADAMCDQVLHHIIEAGKFISSHSSERAE